jgi:2-methylcitrate dehydratase PrpD
MTLASELAGFTAGLSFDDLPEHIVEAAKIRILDTIGSGIWGRHEGGSGGLMSLVDELGGNAEASVWGEKIKIPAIWAAFINGFSSFYVADTDRFCGSHGGAVVVPSAMALAERRNVSGKQLITAVVVGYEVFARVGLALYPAISRKGFHTTGVIGPLGAAAAASKILRLDSEKTTNALSIAALSGMGLGEAFCYLETVSLNIGRVSQAGVMAALLAEKGFKGSDAILEGGNFIKDGFLSALVGTYDPEVIVRDLGTEYKIFNSAPKIHWGCRHLAAPTDAVMELVAEHRIEAENIEEIRIREYSEAFRLERPEVKSREDALWSSRFTIAVAVLTGGPAYPSKFTDEMLNNEAVRKIMAKVRIEVNPELDRDFPAKWPAQVEIWTKDGRSYEGRLDYPRGEPESQLSLSELVDKFMALTEADLGKKKAEEIVETIRMLDQKSVEDLAGLYDRLFSLKLRAVQHGCPVGTIFCSLRLTAMPPGDNIPSIRRLTVMELPRCMEIRYEKEQDE